MDKKSKIFFAVLTLIIIGSVAVSYFKFMVKRDYVIEAQMDCDPMAETCFEHTCDAEADEECSGNLEEDTSYYQLIHRNAKNIPMCDPDSEGCAAYECPVGEPECEIVPCSDAMLDETQSGDACSDPAEYSTTHPVTEEPADEEPADGAEAGDAGPDAQTETVPVAPQEAVPTVGSGE